jgi:hypothetical protein
VAAEFAVVVLVAVEERLPWASLEAVGTCWNERGAVATDEGEMDGAESGKADAADGWRLDDAGVVMDAATGSAGARLVGKEVGPATPSPAV